MSKAVPKLSRKAKIWLFISLGLVVLAVAASILLVLLLNSSGRFRLDDEYYGTSDQTAIDDEEYNKLIADKKSFVVFVDKPGCLQTASMSEWLADFPSEMQFKYYNLRWAYAKKTSLHDYVKFTPSIALIREGEVVAWLDADSADDAEYYKNADALKSWFQKYIAF